MPLYLFIIETLLLIWRPCATYIYLKFYVFVWSDITWWRHQMETFSALLPICAENSPVPGEFPAQRPVTRSFDVFFDLRMNKRLSKQPWGWWFETPAWTLWRHRNEPRFLTQHNSPWPIRHYSCGKQLHKHPMSVCPSVYLSVHHTSPEIVNQIRWNLQKKFTLWKDLERIAWNLGCWCNLATFRTDYILVTIFWVFFLFWRNFDLVRQAEFGFPCILRRMYTRNDLKFCMLMYPGHLETWLNFGHGLLNFFTLVKFDWVRQNNFGVSVLRRTHGRTGLKLGIMMYLDHFQNLI